MGDVWVPQLGFRSADGLRMRERAIVRQDDRAIAIVMLVSTAAGTELSFEIKDDRQEDACIVGTFDHEELHRLDVSLRDQQGRSYARSTTLQEGTGIGQHEFGFFSRTVGFEPLHPDARRLELHVGGALGEWTVPVAVVPTVDTDAAPKRPIDASATTEGITVRLLGIALSANETVVEIEATSAVPVSVRGIGAMLQREGVNRLALIAAGGLRYEEELSRETITRPRERPGRSAAKFPALPADVTELTLVIPGVVVEEAGATLEFTPPITSPREMMFGPYRVVLASALFADDLLSPPGQAPAKGLRVALGAKDPQGARRVVGLSAVAVDGVERPCGWGYGWHPDPGMTNYTLDLDPSARPATITLLRPIVRIAGPWEIRFRLPALT
jgi:hypothetical protein